MMALERVEQKNTPSALGYRMPAEWEEHEAVWLAWPHDKTTFPDRIEKVEKIYSDIIKALEGSERIHLLVLDQSMEDRAKNILQHSGCDLQNIIFHQTEYADVWLRDYGPTFLVHDQNKTSAMVDWEYNAYGKFPDLLKDNQIPSWMNSFLQIPSFVSGIVMEGGSFDVNGKGTVLTTEQCLLHKNRNSHLTKDEIEEYLKTYLNVQRVIWLKEGIVNDHTDGHVDDIARFVDEKTIVYAYEDDVSDDNHRILDENYQILLNARDQEGKPFKLIRLPMPKQDDEKGERLPVSYANFYIANTVVLVPTFDDPHDAEALRIFESLFPDRRVVGISCKDVIYGGGTLHCMSQQQPKAYGST